MGTPSSEPDKKHSGRLFGIIAAVVCGVSVIAMIAALAVTDGKTEKFVPPPFEETAKAGTPEVPEKLGWSEVNAETYKFSVCGVFSPESGKADVWLTNPKQNSVWLKVRVLDKDGNTLGETGLIRPGEYVRSVKLNAVPKDGDSVNLKIMAYEPDTYYSAGTVSLNTTVKGDAS